MRQRWLLDAARVDFSSILEPFWEALALRFSFVGVLERSSKFHEFQMLSKNKSRAVVGGYRALSGALQPSLLKHSKLQNTNCTSIDEEMHRYKKHRRKMQNDFRSLLPLTRRGRRIFRWACICWDCFLSETLTFSVGLYLLP